MAVIRGSASFQTTDEHGHQRGSQAFKSWLFSIAHRRVADYWRKQYRSQAVIQPESDDPDLIERQEGNSASQPDQQYAMYQFEQVLQKLPEPQRQSFILREEGFSYQEIADITEVGTETVKSRLRYANQTLKACLDTDHD